jgi:RNA polymerase sigma factor (sigma-70 family)
VLGSGSTIDSPPGLVDGKAGLATVPTDIELLRAWTADDPGPGQELYRRHFACVHRFFANKVGNDRDVEDLIQRTFLACIEARERYAEAAAFRTWLLGIANNLLREHYRRGRRRRAEIDFESDSVRDLCEGPSTLLRNLRDRQALLEALRAIPVECQVILELFYWERFTGPELGAFLGVPENTARSRLRRARALLLEALERDASTPRSPAGRDDLDAWAAEVRALAFGDED